MGPELLTDLSVFERVASVISGRFIPVDDLTRKKKDERPVTLFSAVMGSFGLDHKDSFLSARNHDELRRAVKWTYSILDEVTETRSQPWAMQPGRAEKEVVNALFEAGRRHPSTAFDGLTADLRVGLSRVTGRGKMRGAIACEAARAAVLKDIEFAEVISPLASEGVSDDDLLAELESLPGQVETEDVDWPVAKKWTLGYNEYLKTEPLDLSLGAYCAWLIPGWRDVTNEQLIACLESIVRKAA